MDTKSAKAIKELRYRLGMTQEQLAVALGVTVSAVHRWESGKAQPSPLAIKAMETINHKANSTAST
jgi:putative transcriptional regulator